MKSVSKFFTKFVIVALLCLTITSSIIGAFFPPQNAVRLCAEDNSTNADDDDVEPFPALLYT